MTPLKAALIEGGTYQYIIAQRAGMTETRLSRIIRGRATPTPSEQERIAAALCVPKRDLFGQKATPVPQASTSPERDPEGQL